MVKVDIATVHKVIAAITDERNPQAQSEALSTRDRWLAEVDGPLQMNDEVRVALETA